jgi:hypothetical protein
MKGKEPQIYSIQQMKKMAFFVVVDMVGLFCCSLGL